MVKTYQLAETVALDLTFLRERHKRQELKAKQLIAFHQGLKNTFEEILNTGEKAKADLRGQGRTWWAQKWATRSNA